ncbi:hypothetical protein BESB_029920 [Besnoitia besnoiti]|uniref:Uncharacterized protein n=1 Tax=Besnoitia besnoiti TaxID=94643 RepID=A0A2A9LXA4_BESBE|nr:hypothetical protein BESB_029920 [Besnoitia besnoiti]PFH31118.1 hypothetical protein BESB_029920 [Besnoitia besnoiti]
MFARRGGGDGAAFNALAQAAAQAAAAAAAGRGAGSPQAEEASASPAAAKPRREGGWTSTPIPERDKLRDRRRDEQEDDARRRRGRPREDSWEARRRYSRDELDSGHRRRRDEEAYEAGGGGFASRRAHRPPPSAAAHSAREERPSRRDTYEGEDARRAERRARHRAHDRDGEASRSRRRYYDEDGGGGSGVGGREEPDAEFDEVEAGDERERKHRSRRTHEREDARGARDSEPRRHSRREDASPSRRESRNGREGEEPGGSERRGGVSPGASHDGVERREASKEPRRGHAPRQHCSKTSFGVQQKPFQNLTYVRGRSESSDPEEMPSRQPETDEGFDGADKKAGEGAEGERSGDAIPWWEKIAAQRRGRGGGRGRGFRGGYRGAGSNYPGGASPARVSSRRQPFCEEAPAALARNTSQGGVSLSSPHGCSGFFVPQPGFPAGSAPPRGPASASGESFPPDGVACGLLARQDGAFAAPVSIQLRPRAPFAPPAADDRETFLGESEKDDWGDPGARPVVILGPRGASRGPPTPGFPPGAQIRGPASPPAPHGPNTAALPSTGFPRPRPPPSGAFPEGDGSCVPFSPRPPFPPSHFPARAPPPPYASHAPPRLDGGAGDSLSPPDGLAPAAVPVVFLSENRSKRGFPAAPAEEACGAALPPSGDALPGDARAEETKQAQGLPREDTKFEDSAAPFPFANAGGGEAAPPPSVLSLGAFAPSPPPPPPPPSGPSGFQGPGFPSFYGAAPPPAGPRGPYPLRGGEAFFSGTSFTQSTPFGGPPGAPASFPRGDPPLARAPPPNFVPMRDREEECREADDPSCMPFAEVPAGLPEEPEPTGEEDKLFLWLEKELAAVTNDKLLAEVGDVVCLELVADSVLAETLSEKTGLAIPRHAPCPVDVSRVCSGSSSLSLSRMPAAALALLEQLAASDDEASLLDGPAAAARGFACRPLSAFSASPVAAALTGARLPAASDNSLLFPQLVRRLREAPRAEAGDKRQEDEDTDATHAPAPAKRQQRDTDPHLRAALLLGRAGASAAEETRAVSVFALSSLPSPGSLVGAAEPDAPETRGLRCLEDLGWQIDARGRLRRAEKNTAAAADAPASANDEQHVFHDLRGYEISEGSAFPPLALWIS